MSKKYTLAVLALILAVSIVASGCTEKSDNPSETTISEVMPEMPETFEAKTEFTASDVIKISSGENPPRGQIYNPNVGGTLFYTGSIAAIKELTYEGSGFTVEMKEGSLRVFPKTTALKVTSVNAYDSKWGIIDGKGKNKDNGVILTSRTGIYDAAFLKIGFRPT